MFMRLTKIGIKDFANVDLLSTLAAAGFEWGLFQTDTPWAWDLVMADLTPADFTDYVPVPSEDTDTFGGWSDETTGSAYEKTVGLAWNSGDADPQTIYGVYLKKDAGELLGILYFDTPVVMNEDDALILDVITGIAGTEMPSTLEHLEH